MCEYVKENICTLNNEICPFVYFCNKRSIWRPIKNAPKECNIKTQAEAPIGFYRVRQERKGILYFDVGDFTQTVKNSLDYTPLYIKATKTKSGWKLKDWSGVYGK